jgi:hypothetical protein
MDASGIGPWGFVRRVRDESVLALYNFASEEVEVTLPEIPFPAVRLVDLISGAEFPPPTPGRAYVLKMAPASALMLAEQ